MKSTFYIKYTGIENIHFFKVNSYLNFVEICEKRKRISTEAHMLQTSVWIEKNFRLFSMIWSTRKETLESNIFWFSWRINYVTIQSHKHYAQPAGTVKKPSNQGHNNINKYFSSSSSSIIQCSTFSFLVSFFLS